MKRVTCVVAVGTMMMLAVLAAPAAAQAPVPAFEGLLTGHLGMAAGRDGRGNTLSLGAAVAVVETSGWGAELDFGFADADNGRNGGLDAQSYMLNVIRLWSLPRLRPFVTGGGGVMRARTCVDGCAGTLGWNDWAVNAGAGALYPLNESAAARVDVRYFTVPGQHPDPARPRGFAFWRISAGVTYRWNAD